MFLAHAVVGALATLLVATLVPETLKAHDELTEGGMADPMPLTSDLSTTL